MFYIHFWYPFFRFDIFQGMPRPLWPTSWQLASVLLLNFAVFSFFALFLCSLLAFNYRAVAVTLVRPVASITRDPSPGKPLGNPWKPLENPPFPLYKTSWHRSRAAAIRCIRKIRARLLDSIN